MLFCSTREIGKVMTEATRTALKRNSCMECGHDYYRHEVSINTRQRGICLEDGCKCVNPETPCKDEMWDEIERLQAENAKLRTALEQADELIMKAAVHSTHTQQWRCVSEAHSAIILALGKPEPTTAGEEGEG